MKIALAAVLFGAALIIFLGGWIVGERLNPPRQCPEVIDMPTLIEHAKSVCFEASADGIESITLTSPTEGEIKCHFPNVGVIPLRLKQRPAGDAILAREVRP